MPEINAAPFLRNSPRGAFTLLELLIVILLLSLFAFLVFGTMKRQASQPKQPKVSQIREILAKGAGRDQELVCLENCRKCFFLDGEHRMRETGIHFPPMRAYILDPSDQAREPDFGRWKDKRICLRIRGYANGSMDQMILESEGVFYFFPAYFGKVERFKTLGEAVDYWLRNRDLFHDQGDYY